MRIARELHDIVAHDMSTMLVLTQAARRTLHADPQRAGAAIAAAGQVGAEALAELRRARPALADAPARAGDLHDAVADALVAALERAEAAADAVGVDAGAADAALGDTEESGRGALEAMRRLLGLLRPGDEEAPHTPQPTLERLGALVARAADGGLAVEVRVEGEPHSLPASIDLTAFRLVEEALAVALSRGGPGYARVTLRWAEDALEVEIADRGGPPRPVVGMRERVALVGGELHAGPLGRGFVIRARLPRGEAVSPPAPAAA